MRIALLEDDLDQAKLIEVWLSDAGHQPYIYYAGSQMLGALNKENGWKLTSVYQHGYRLEPDVD